MHNALPSEHRLVCVSSLQSARCNALRLQSKDMFLVVPSQMKYILHTALLGNVTVCITFLWNGICHLVLRDLREHH